ncbi:DUF115 domain-containing protein [Shewanella sp. Scap07]|uniref:6-hydroxymethylpterin diphosphokinase MptE-like protein n=1 Tax=Shewanella sp. Scap07 TaxID=2589987 RepID=UPI0015C0DCBE|nr:6-hydroxymethylpterin diphosphokinase MptE-like protein [Shewanella sp. Scap07]QLE86198.1 DUF115 domain-containing protein [Shewanella sp. Scap07]
MLNNQTEIASTFAVSQFNEYYLPSVNRKTFEKIDSTTLYNNKFKTSFSIEDTLHIIVGLDSGLFANFVMNSLATENSKYVFVESDTVLSMLTIDIPAEQQEMIHVVSFDEFADLIKEPQFNLYIVKQQFRLHRSLAVESNHLESYTILYASVDNTLKQEFFEQSIGFSQKSFVKTQLKNMAETNRPASVLKQKFIGKTCLILGAGPSLDDEVAWLKENAANLVIIAVSRIVGKLQTLAIKPDIIVSVDPQAVSFDVNKDLMSLPAQSLLICSYHVTPLILGQWGGSVLYTGTKYPWISSAANDNVRSMGPTVTNAALEIAIEMGFEKILMLGADFCHSQAGVSHTSGTYGASLGPNIGTMYEWVETYSGEMAETPIQLLGAAESIAEQVRDNSNPTYINLSKNAAKIPGVIYQAATDIKLNRISTEHRALLSPSQHHCSNEEYLQSLSHASDQLITTRKKLNALIEKNSDALHLIDKIEKNINSNEKVAKFANKLEKIEASLNNQYSSLSALIKFYGYYEFSHFLSTKSMDEGSDWTQEEINARTRIYYNAFKDMGNEILDHVEQALTLLAMRTAEFSSSPNLDELIKYWRENDLCGRALIWQQRNPEKYEQLSSTDKANLAQCQQDYLDLFIVKAYINTPEDKQVRALDKAQFKLQTLMLTKHLLGISKMAQYTAPFIDSDLLVARLHNLALSYQYTLEGDNAQALTAVMQTPESDRHEEELKQIVQLSLKLSDLESALQHYPALTKFSDEYLPLYAHSLRLAERPQEALEVYLDYLDKYPQDIPVTLKLGIFLAEVGQIDGAKSCFLQVLDIDPDNYAAKNYLQQVGG